MLRRMIDACSGALMKCFDNDADPAEGLDSLTAWTRLDYDDSAWKTGKAPFGTKKGSSATINGHSVATLLNYYKPDSTDSIAAAFFRTSVTIEDPTSYAALEMTIAADDCVAIYINGTLVVDGRKTTPTSNTQYIGTKWRENTVTLTGSSLSCLF